MALTLISKNGTLAHVAPKVLCGIATEGEIMALKREDFLAIRTDSSEIHVRSHFSEVEKVVEEKAGAAASRTRRFVASDETPDRYGDVILVKGWDFAEFALNPQALWAHDAGSLPIGTVSDFTKGKVNGKPALKESITYFDATVNPMSETILRLVDAGGIRAVSVGFIPADDGWKRGRDLTEEERALYGVSDYGVLFTKVKQIELSNCTIPANPNALISKSLVPMVREMEASGELPAAVARDFYRAVEQLESESGRRVFALGAPGESGDGETAAEQTPAASSLPTEEKAVADPAAAAEAELAALESQGDAQTEEKAAEEELAPTLEQRLAALEAAHAALAQSHTETRALLARSVQTIESLLGALEQEAPSGSDQQTSAGEPTKTVAVSEQESASYLALVLTNDFREALNR